MVAEARLIFKALDGSLSTILRRISTYQLCVVSMFVVRVNMMEDENKGHPTEPSNEIPNSFCASTANSIGSCCSTSRAKPFTISATAAS